MRGQSSPRRHVERHKGSEQNADLKPAAPIKRGRSTPGGAENIKSRGSHNALCAILSSTAWASRRTKED
jgi:hypothetical protein